MLEEPVTEPTPVQHLPEVEPSVTTDPTLNSEWTDPGLEGKPATNPPGNWLDLPPSSTAQGQRCLEIAKEALTLFVEKNNSYGEPDSDDLGSRGQYADMHRKWKLLRRHLWDGEPWRGNEPFEEVVFDFVGHLLLTVDFKRREQ